MPDLVTEIALVVLGMVGIVWCTLYTAAAYYMDRLAEMEEMGERLAGHEIDHTFVRPCMMEHLLQWAHRDSLRLCPRPGDDRLISLFVDLHCATQLTDAEYDEAVRITARFLSCQFWLTPRSLLLRTADDACCQHVWRTVFFVDLVTHLTDIYSR